MDKQELNKKVEAHKLWVETEGDKGKRLNLSDAKLSGANLRGAKKFIKLYYD